MSAVGKSYLNYFQDYNPCREFLSTSLPSRASADIFTAIGLYIIVS